MRRMFALLMALVMAVGLATHGIGGPMIVNPTMIMASDMPSSGGPMQGKCNGCAADEKGVVPAACSAFCSAVAALPAANIDLFAVPAETLTPAVGPEVTGWTHPPDPYPPRTTILS